MIQCQCGVMAATRDSKSGQKILSCILRNMMYSKPELFGSVVELADTADSKSAAAKLEGSNPSVATHKKCNKCDSWKELICFSMKKGSRHSVCKTCVAAYNKTHYKKNKELYLLRAKTNVVGSIKRNQQFIQDYKNSHPCVDCGIQYSYYVMDFDHRDPQTKVANISRLTRQAFSLELIQSELEKCDIVCANCHRIRTFRKP